jgi:hypothetical protein
VEKSPRAVAKTAAAAAGPTPGAAEPAAHAAGRRAPAGRNAL